jgi:hypothetical protein
MPEKTLTPRMLVRYDSTTARWFIAVVRQVSENDVQLAYLDGFKEYVYPEKVTPFRDSLRGRSKILSVNREDLCYRMFSEELTRINSGRIRKMKKLLRTHGLCFEPSGDWPSNCRVRIWPDESFTGNKSVAIDKDFQALLPKWLAPHRLPPGSRDPLGFQSHAERIADEMLPGLTVFTSRIGYYGFIAWAIQRLNEFQLTSHGNRRELFHRLERTLVLCEFIHHGEDDKNCRLLGQRSRSEVLQSAEGNRFGVPKRILRNQESTGSLRLYATSMESNGFAILAPELAAENLLPFKLTELGERLAREFEKRIPAAFFDFALSDRRKDREELRKWGAELCFYELGLIQRYRETFLNGFIFGNSKEAEARYQTVRKLFKRKLLRDEYTPRSATKREQLLEDEAPDSEEVKEVTAMGGIDNAEVLLTFYEENPSEENRLPQKAAVFELLSISMVSIFAHAMHAIEENGRSGIEQMLQGIVNVRKHGPLWLVPFLQAGKKVPDVRKLESMLWAAEDTAQQAAVGGLLAARVAADPVLQAVAVDLDDSPVLKFLEKLPPEKSLADSFPDLLSTMVDRHEIVSKGKNRQRWCYLEGTTLMKDELRPLGVGWHSMRFPQLFSLCRDLRLQKDEIVHGR